jgi:hypothetical protein
MAIANPKVDRKVDAMIDLARSFDTEQVRQIAGGLEAIVTAAKGLMAVLLTDEQKQNVEKIFRG